MEGGSKIVWRHRYRHDDLAPSLHRHLFPWDAQNESIIVHRVARVARCLELNRQLVCLQLDSDDVVADEVSVITFGAIPEMLADGACDARLDFGCRMPRENGQIRHSNAARTAWNAGSHPHRASALHRVQETAIIPVCFGAHPGNPG